MTYTSLGPRTLVGTPDLTGNNAGNWTVQFSPDIIALSTQIPVFEVYHIAVKGAPGSSFTVSVDINLWDAVPQGFLNSWDPAEPLLLTQGNTLYFYYSDPITDGTPPTVTIWLRYNKDLFS
jgi:hypothetical protein